MEVIRGPEMIWVLVIVRQVTLAWVGSKVIDDYNVFRLGLFQSHLTFLFGLRYSILFVAYNLGPIG